MSNKVQIKNLSSYGVTINLPNVRFRRSLNPYQSCTLPEDVFEEFNYDSGCREMVRAGAIKVITEDPEIKEQIVEVPAVVEVDIKELLTEKTVSELNNVLKEASANLRSRIAEEAINLSVADLPRVTLIKKYCNVDVVEAISLQRSVENN